MSTKPFDRKAFKKEVEQWLSYKKTFEEKRPFYRFLAVITLINLSRLADRDLKSMWGNKVIKYSYAIYRIPLILFTAATADKAADAETYVSYDADAAYDAACSGQDADAAYNAYSAAYAAAYTHAHAYSADATADAANDAAMFTLRSAVMYEVHNLWSHIVLKESKISDNISPLLKIQIISGIEPLTKIGLNFLYNDLLTMIDYYLASQEPKPNYWGRIINYSKSLDLISSTEFSSSQSLDEALFGKSYPAFIRTLIVGHGGSGKTTLFQLLAGEKVGDDITATIDFNQKEINDCCKHWGIINDNKTNVGSTLKMELWDFAGQTQYYGLHQAFFNESCFFIVVVDSRHQQSPYDWIQQINLLANSGKISVLIVVNTYENCPSQLNFNDIKRNFPYINLAPVVQLNLGNYRGRLLDYFKNSKEYPDELKQLLESLNTLSQIVKRKMGKSSYNFQQKIRERLQKSLYITDEELKKMTALEVNDFEEWVKLFGLVLPSELSNEKVWLSANWLNNAGYHFLSALQSKSALAYKISTIKQLNKEITRDECNILLDKFQTDSMSLAIKINDKFIFPSILPADDPYILNQLDDSSDYNLYGTFYVHIEFMPMGLFSRWVAQWLSLKSNVRVGDEHYSRYCCILSKNDTHLAIKWHPHYRTLKFALYQRVNDDKTEIFTDLLSVAFDTIDSALDPNKSDKYRIATTETNILGERIQNNNSEMLDFFIKDLKKLAKDGFMYHYFIKFKELGKYNNMTIKNYNAENQSIIDKNEGGATQVINKTININTNTQNNYLNALEKLKTAYMAEQKDEQKQQTFQKVYEVAKTDVEQNKLSEEKVGVLDSIVTGLDKGKKVGDYVLTLIKIYAALLV